MRLRKYLFAGICGATLVFGGFQAHAFQILGGNESTSGAGFLIGNDLTDPEGDGTLDGQNYNAVFSASSEPGFGGGEFAFNVFSNTVGGGTNKWCCGNPTTENGTFPIWVDATLSEAFVLTSFTITSGNDSPNRDPRIWEIQGSNGGGIFTTIFSRNIAGSSDFTDRNQTIQYFAGDVINGTTVDFVKPAAYTTFRFVTTATGTTGGAQFALGELEYFGTPASVPEPSTAALALGSALGICALRRRRR